MGRVYQTSGVSVPEARRPGRPARLGATCRVIRRLRREYCDAPAGHSPHDQVSPIFLPLPAARGGRGDLITPMMRSDRPLTRTRPDTSKKR